MNWMKSQVSHGSSLMLEQIFVCFWTLSFKIVTSLQLTAAVWVSHSQMQVLRGKMLSPRCYFPPREQFTISALSFLGMTSIIDHPASTVVSKSGDPTTYEPPNITCKYEKNCPTRWPLLHPDMGLVWVGHRKWKEPSKLHHPQAGLRCSPRLRQGSVWLLSRLCCGDGEGHAFVWPRACMLDVVIISTPCPPGGISPSRRNWWALERLWTCSAAVRVRGPLHLHCPLGAPLHQPQPVPTVFLQTSCTAMM